MKPLFAISLLLLSTSVYASQSEVRHPSAVCRGKGVSITFYAHGDILRSGQVDLLVKTTGPLADTYLVNDVIPEAIAGTDLSHISFTDGDVTIDLQLDNAKMKGTLKVDDSGNTIRLRCRELD